MGNLQLKGFLNILSGKLKQIWARITNNRLAYANGKAGELRGKIQWKTGQSTSQLGRWFRRL